MRGRFGAWNPPGVLCHEICGEVVELGDGAKGVGPIVARKLAAQ